MHELLAAERFQLAAYGRYGDAAAPLRIYIEGDGYAWEDRHTPSLNPTPTNPVALRLAALDPAPNVVWLARPCQYEGYNESCDEAYWTWKRFAPEVIFAYEEALDALKQRHGARALELVGFSGGGAIAALLAARRADVITLRTVAGNLDTEAFTKFHDVSPMPASVNPREEAKKTALIPQLHISGGKDEIVPELIYESYANAEGRTPCLHHLVVKKASHEKGWEEAWPQLLQEKLSCFQ